MTMELTAPATELRRRFGISDPKLVEATKAIQIRKLIVADPVTGAEATYLSATDLLELLDREYEVTESKHVLGLAKVVRQMAGKV